MIFAHPQSHLLRCLTSIFALSLCSRALFSVALFTGTVFTGLVSANTESTRDIPNALIDYPLFQNNVNHVATLRRDHRITEQQFLALAAKPGTVVLDARSARMFARLHVTGAVNLSFPDFTEQELANIIPDKASTILIYCNNNFRNAPNSFPAKTPAASLNVHTFTALHSYGYHNVYELGPLLDVNTTAIALVGTDWTSRNATANANRDPALEQHRDISK